MELTTAAKEMHQLRKDLAAHIEDAKKRDAALREQIRVRATVLSSAVEGLDMEKITLAKTVVYVRGAYERAGEDRASVISDAIKQLATGEPNRAVYGDLWHRYFGTKNYDRWSGQRSDHEYMCAPRHGSICFAVGLTDEVRDTRQQGDLTAAEVEAAIYYLTNIQRVQEAERKAREQAAA